MSLLEAKNVGIQFGGLRAVNDFNLSVNTGELVAIIGPNGAGKTTVFNILTGMYVPTDGEILLEGKSVVNKLPCVINHMGIARTFQNIRLFSNLSVLDNVKIAMKGDAKYGFFDALIRSSRYHKYEEEIEQRAKDLLKLFDMENAAGFRASNLPYGEQRRLEIVRALGTNPKLLLLDEPAAGMNSVEIDDMMAVIADVRKRFKELSILLIEHHMSMVMSIAERITVLDFGETIAEGTPEAIGNDPKVIEAYLGKGGARLGLED